MNVLRDIDISHGTYMYVYAYVYKLLDILYSAWASRCCSKLTGNAKASKSWNGNSRTPRFFVCLFV